MIETDKHPNICIDCKAVRPLGMKYRIGKEMWHYTVWTCKHEIILQCPECVRKENDSGTYHKCSVCGCVESYT